jgi:hypothetical protein
MGSARLTANWDPKTNKAVADTPMTTIEINNRKPPLTNNYISFRYQILGAGRTPYWPHSGDDPTYGSVFARITYGVTSLAKLKSSWTRCRFRKALAHPKGMLGEAPATYICAPMGGPTRLYSKGGRQKY